MTNGGELLPTLKYPNGYVKADVNASIDVLEKLFHDNKRRKELANQGYNKWKNSFTWEQITKQYENLYINLLNSKKDEL
jgi:glycosyltransferase involved in cell wall biosynthesis